MKSRFRNICLNALCVELTKFFSKLLIYLPSNLVIPFVFLIRTILHSQISEGP